MTEHKTHHAAHDHGEGGHPKQAERERRHPCGHHERECPRQ